MAGHILGESDSSTPQDKPRVSRVNEVAYGVYVWQLPSGGYLGNSDGDYLSVFCMKSDIKAMAQLREVAAAHGFPEGKPVFVPGAEKVTQSQWEDQVARMRDGYIPNPNDPGNFSNDV